MSIRRTAVAALLCAMSLGSVATAQAPTLYDFTLNRIDGTEESLAAYRGKVLVLVNVASKCGFTPQYEGLEALYDRYGSRGFAVLGFPSNDFRGQEPGTNAEIAEFCRATWSVQFPMFEKIVVRGDGQHPLVQLADFAAGTHRGRDRMELSEVPGRPEGKHRRAPGARCRS